jgi:hypothetical protein
MINVARSTSEIKPSFAVIAKAAFKKKKKTLFTSKLYLNLRKKLVKSYIWSIALCGAEIWRLWKVDQKYLESFEMWCSRRMVKTSSIGRVRNEEVLHGVKEKRNIIHAVKIRKANWIGYILRRNRLLKLPNKDRRNRSDGKTRKKT